MTSATLQMGSLQTEKTEFKGESGNSATLQWISLQKSLKVLCFQASATLQLCTP